MKEEDKKKFNYKRHHAHATKDDALSGAVTLGSDTWLVDSGASKHMTS